ncbi:protein artemis-like [Battus philenor]|uniref:protein artemis-like n=1 Tax=Battus philenor TaxID=42288 RepID=UPI0035CECB70
MACDSSFHGKICEIPGIAVDNFKGENVNARAFFLSHYHMDHVQGLKTGVLYNHLRRNNVFIYTSEITASIIEYENGSELRDFVKPLRRSGELITLPSVPDKGLEELLVEVTLIPAGHSFGSTMFLFKTAKITVLYTGDFRIRINDIPKYSKLHNSNGEPIRIDAMYVDTTFIERQFEEFAKRSDTVDSVINEIDTWLKASDDHAISIFMYAKYTFEFLFNKIYQRLKMKVYVNNDKWALYRTLKDQVPGITNNERETRIHLCMYKFGTNDHGKCISLRDDKRYLHIHLTAAKWKNYTADDAPINRLAETETTTKIDACFSTHCSRSELMSFVKYFNPMKIEGFPFKYVDDGTTSCSDKKFVLSPKSKMTYARKKQYETAHVDGVMKKIF